TDDFLNFARAQPIVIDAVGLPDVMRELRRGILEEGDVLPQSIDEATQLLFLTELGDYSVEDLYRQDAGLAQAVLAVRDDGSQLMRPFLDRLEQYMSENPPPFGSAVITGTAQMKLSYSTQLVRTFGPTLVLAVLLVFAVLVKMFGSVRTALVTLIPNFFPLVAIMAAMKLGGVDLKPSTIMVFSIAFGLAVDDTMHLLDTVRDRLREGANLTQAIEDGLLDTGPAILMTSVTMSAGFLLLTGSQFQILVLVGVMTVVSAAAAVAADLFLLPSLLTLTQANEKTPTH
ncbi:MAG: MMPL family transporter, partial [Gemmatimonadota bacterium]|nr:MMPL family transporter [Gemmatimonadota bacterium]